MAELQHFFLGDCFLLTHRVYTEEDEWRRVRNPFVFQTKRRGCCGYHLPVSRLSNKYVNYQASHVVLSHQQMFSL